MSQILPCDLFTYMYVYIISRIYVIKIEMKYTYHFNMCTPSTYLFVCFVEIWNFDRTIEFQN